MYDYEKETGPRQRGVNPNSANPANIRLKPSWSHTDSRPISPSGEALKSYTKRVPSPSNHSEQTNVRQSRPTAATSGKSVAALQQHHQWLMQQQQQQQRAEAGQNSRKSNPPGAFVSSFRNQSPSPVSSISKTRLSFVPQEKGPTEHEGGSEGEYDSIEETQRQTRKPSISKARRDDRSDAGSTSASSTSGLSTMRSDRSLLVGPNFTQGPTSTSTNGPQEFTVAKEGWLYKKNSLMQWKPVYVVAKHGNAVKPGGLYIYKDDKFSNHIQTYDMSEVVEVQPRAQEYKTGIKWEMRILVKREDVILATDDFQARKDWVTSLTSIMGKVSIASHNQLQTRTISAEHMNRDLQAINDELEAENIQLRDRLARIEEQHAKKEHTMEIEHRERESVLATELDHMRQTLDTRSELMENEMTSWRNKANHLERQMEDWQAKEEESERQLMKNDALEQEILKWRLRVDDLEYIKKQMEYKITNQEKADRTPETYHKIGRREGRYNSNQNEDCPDSVKETLSDVKYSLQALRDQVKLASEGNPAMNLQVSDIKSSTEKLCKTLDEAREEWTELQHGILRFMESESEDGKNNSKSDKQTQVLDELRREFSDLREELIGSDEKGNESSNNTISLSGKFDVLMQMMEMLQLSQTRLMSFCMDKDDSSDRQIATDDISGVHTMLGLLKDKISDGIDKEGLDTAVQSIQDTLQAHQKQTGEWINDMRKQSEDMLEKVGAYLEHQKDTDPETSKSDVLDNHAINYQLQEIHESISTALQSSTEELKESQKEGRDDYEKSLKVLGHLFQHVIQQIEASAIPDLPGLSQQLEEVVDRLMMTEERLSRLNSNMGSYPRQFSAESETTMRDISSNQETLTDEAILGDIRELVMGTRGYMERTLRVLDRFGGSHVGMEETVRRAVKSAFNSHLGVDWQDPTGQKKLKQDNTEDKLKKYEDNARGYFDKSMLSMREHLEEYTGIMYKMVEDLVLRAIDHIDQKNSASKDFEDIGKQKSLNLDGNNTQRLDGQTVELVDLHARLSVQKDSLEAEIKSLQSERTSLQESVQVLRVDNKAMEQEIQAKKLELQAVMEKCESVTREIQRKREENISGIAKDLEPLIRQIAKLKQISSLGEDSIMSDDSEHSTSSGYIDINPIKPGNRGLPNNEKNQRSRSKSPLPSLNAGRPRPDYNSTRSTNGSEPNDARKPSPNAYKLPSLPNDRRVSFGGAQSTPPGVSDKQWKPPRRGLPLEFDSSPKGLSGGRERPRAPSPLADLLGRGK
ncbi:hypothetical protein J3Q64DRAFT_1820184 [Phycomyces blakesleeanus]|uniref:PH domain-containing protein n=1 Tax=Phycomyces blakesleeanus TaxID=4837 RepID=A0ABR3B674_PHYBL